MWSHTDAVADGDTGFIETALQMFGAKDVAAVLALFSAVLALPAFWTAGVHSDAVTQRTSGTQVLKEPYLDLAVVRKLYHDEVPRVVELAVRDFDQGTNVDLVNDTQDYQTRYSPAFTCGENRSDVVALYGPGACTGGSRFYSVSTQYERGLIVFNGRGDPATSADISLPPADLRIAARFMRAAESELVACTIVSKETRPINVSVSPASGYRVEGEKSFTLEPKGQRRVVLRPDETAGGAAIGQAGCTIDYDLASSVKNAARARPWIVVAGILALGSFLLGVRAKRREKAAD